MPGAGDLRDLVRFERRGLDANNDRLGDWAGEFTCTAQVLFLRGGEAVLSSRLEGRQPAVITVRDFAQSRAVTPDFRAVDVRRGTVFNIRGIAPARERGFVDVTAEAIGPEQ